MEHTIKVNGNYVAAMLQGKIYSQNAAVIKEKLLAQLEGTVTEMRIDISKLTYIDTAGLKLFITLYKRIKEKNGTFILTGAQGIVSELLSLTRLNRIFLME